MIPQLHILLYLRVVPDGGGKSASFIRAYKYLDKPKNLTPAHSHMVYSYKAKRYVLAALYPLEWSGKQAHGIFIEPTMLRASLLRIGLDVR